MPGVLSVHEGDNASTPSHSGAFWPKLLSIFSLFYVTTFIERSHVLTIPLTLAPDPLDASRSPCCLTVSRSAFRLRVVVGRLLTGRYLPALLPKGTAGGTAGSAYGLWPYGTITYATSRRTTFRNP